MDTLRKKKLNRMNAFERSDYAQKEQFCGYVLAVVAVAGIGMSAYSMATAPNAPSYAAPPPPPNSTVYGDDGEILSRQTFDAATNTWTTYGSGSAPPKPTNEWAVNLTGDANLDSKDPAVKAEIERRFQAHVAADPKGVEAHSGNWRFEAYRDMMNEKPKAVEQYNKDLEDYNIKYAKWETDKAARDADKEKLADLRTQMLDNLNQTPEDRQKAYDDYAKSFSDAAHRDVDPRYAKIDRTADEQANATGMFGSRAYVDTKSELAKDKLAQDTDIANQSVMAKEALANNDRAFYANMLNQIDSGARADSLATAQINKSNSDSSIQQYAGILGAYQAQNANKAAEWEAKQRMNASYASAGSNLAGGLLYLYGNKSGSSKPAGGAVPSTNIGNVG